MELVQPIRDVEKIEEFKGILFENGRFGARNHLLFVLGINSRLRISDLLRLRFKDVLDATFKVKKFITLREKKTKKIKQIPVNLSVESAIHMYMDGLDCIDPDQYIFKSNKGKNKPISRHQAWEILNNAAQKAKMSEAIGTHSLRKTFGYHSYQKGIDITLLQKIFNHSAPSITLRYILPSR